MFHDLDCSLAYLAHWDFYQQREGRFGDSGYYSAQPAITLYLIDFNGCWQKGNISRVGSAQPWCGPLSCFADFGKNTRGRAK